MKNKSENVNKPKNFIFKLINVVSCTAIFLAIVVLLSVVFTESGDVPNVLGYSAFRVLTGSMEPEIPTDSFIVVKHVGASEIEEGDVISFFLPDPAYGGDVNTHRVVSIEEEGGSRSFVTRGDANHVDDKYLVTSDHLIGKVVFVSHAIGVVIRLMSNPLLFIPLIIIPLLIILICNLRLTIRQAREIAREEEAEAVRQTMEAIRKAKKLKEEKAEEEE